MGLFFNFGHTCDEGGQCDECDSYDDQLKKQKPAILESGGIYEEATTEEDTT